MSARCPICSKSAHLQFTPFCSKRCADVDLSRWLKGGYAIPGRSPEEDGDEEAQTSENQRGKGPEAGPD